MELCSLNFDPLVECYDETRIVDAANLTAAIGWLAQRFPADEFPELLEPGIGMGRIAVPLAEHGYHVHGVDTSEAMLATLAKRLTKHQMRLRVSYQVADVERLPFASGRFDIVVAVHLFYFIREWKRAVVEILRVLRSGGPLVLMHTGMGMEIPFINDRYKEVCAEQGFAITSLGVSSTQEVVEFLAGHGYQIEVVQDRWRWTNRIHWDQAISYVRRRAYSFTAHTPEAVHAAALRALEKEAQSKSEGPNAKIVVENQIRFVIVSKPLEEQAEPSAGGNAAPPRASA
jgi:ubiquinone/menaquinone biosynthesis C-methylase UbiE